MGGVGLGPGEEQLFSVEVEEFLRVLLIKGVAQHDLRGIGKLLVIEAVHTAEVGDARLGAHAGASKKHDVVAAVDPRLQLFQMGHVPSSFSGGRPPHYRYPTAFFRKRQVPPSPAF